MNRLQRLIATLLAAGALFTTIGCPLEKTKTVTKTEKPLFANYGGMSNDNKFLALFDTREETRGDILSFNAQTQTTGRVKESTETKSFEPRGVIGKKVILQEQNAEEPNDLVVCDLETLAQTFDSETLTLSENIRFLTGNGKVVVDQYNAWSHRNNIAVYDPAANTLEKLIPLSEEAFFRNKQDLIEAREGLNSQMYGFDKQTGEATLLLDSADIQNFGFFFGNSTPDVIAYKQLSDIVFNKTSDGSETVFTIDDGLWYDVMKIESNQALLTPVNGRTLVHFDIETGLRQDIDFSAFPDFDFAYWNNGNVIGSGKTAIQGDDDIPIDVLFYNPATDTVEDLLSAELEAGETARYSQQEQSYEGKALIRLGTESASDRYGSKLLFFDGTDLQDLFSEFSDANTRSWSADRRYILIEGDIGNDEHLVLFDMKTQEKKTIDNITDCYFNGTMFSKDGTKIAYVTRNCGGTNDCSINVYDVETGAVQRDISPVSDDSDWIGLMDFSPDKSKLVIDRGSYSGGPIKTFVVDIETGDSTEVCYN